MALCAVRQPAIVRGHVDDRLFDRVIAVVALAHVRLRMVGAPP
ncbi:MAG: hypothetical protein ABSE77_11305 [Acidimicrobiales bacterium]